MVNKSFMDVLYIVNKPYIRTIFVLPCSEKIPEAGVYPSASVSCPLEDQRTGGCDTKHP